MIQDKIIHKGKPIHQDDEKVIYNGRAVSKQHFRVFIHAADNKKKLVNSWNEFQEHLVTGLWFANKEDVHVIAPQPTIQLQKVQPINTGKHGRK